MRLGAFEDAIGRLMAASTGVVTHGGSGNRVGIHDVLSDDEYSGMTGLGTQDPWTLATDHGDNAIGDSEIHRARAKNIDQNARQAPAFVTVRVGIEFERRAGRRLHLPVMEDFLAIAINPKRRDAEHVLD